MKQILIDRVTVKVIRLCHGEAHLLKNPTAADSEKFSREYIALANSLRLDLIALGLERKEPEIESLQSYLAREYGEEKKNEDA